MYLKKWRSEYKTPQLQKISWNLVRCKREKELPYTLLVTMKQFCIYLMFFGDLVIVSRTVLDTKAFKIKFNRRLDIGR